MLGKNDKGFSLMSCSDSETADILANMDGYSKAKNRKRENLSSLLSFYNVYFIPL